VALGLSAVVTGVRLLPLSITLLAAAGVPKVFPDASPRRVVQLGFLALFAGIVIMVAALDVAASASSRARSAARRWSPLRALGFDAGRVMAPPCPARC
jgi:hypothetical protein